MKKSSHLFITILLFANLSFANFVDASNYLELEVFLREFYWKNLFLSGEVHLSDKGYFSSSLVTFKDISDMKALMTNRMTNEKDMKNAISDILLTNFAHAKLNYKEKQKFSSMIYPQLVKNFHVYVAANDIDLNLESLVDFSPTCGVRDPARMLVLVDKETAFDESAAAYLVFSDICE